VKEPDCPPGWTTGPPDFVGIGAMRSGTSWWFEGLAEHPSVATPAGKEVHFFDRYWRDEAESDFGTLYARFFPRPEGSITGEWTPGYMCDAWAVPMLAEAAPETRYLIMLRDPVERYHSEIADELKRSRERAPDSLSDALSLVIANHAVLHSMYHWQVRRALAILGAERVLVLQYERCVADPLGQMQRTQEFLGLEPVATMPGALQRRVRPPGVFTGDEKPALPARLRSELSSLLADDVRQLEELCPELDIGLWLNFA
jgi:hypothetical protein